MAIPLNRKMMADVVASAVASALITPDSSSTVAVYQISRYWRELFQKATRYPSDVLPQWNEKEVATARIILHALLFLGMEGCEDVEKLLTDVLNANSS